MVRMLYHTLLLVLQNLKGKLDRHTLILSGFSQFALRVKPQANKVGCYMFRNFNSSKTSIAGQTIPFNKPSTPIQKVVACPM